MPIKRPPLINGEIYHIVTRAIDGLKLFRDKKDYLRMIHDLFEFNDENPTGWDFRRQAVKPNSTRTVLEQLLKRRKRKLIVEILAFCLMPNHIHLLVKQLREGGISQLMRKIGAGYGLYYNNKYRRKGHIFQGRFRAVLIKNNEQLKTIFVYIHTNPLAIIMPRWREQGIKNFERAVEFLENYKWSSYPDYLGKRNFPSITSRNFLMKIMEGVENCRTFVNGWLQFKRELTDLKQIALE